MGGLFVYKMLPETKGVPLEEINTLFARFDGSRRVLSYTIDEQNAL